MPSSATTNLGGVLDEPIVLHDPGAVLEGRIVPPSTKGVYVWFFDRMPGTPELEYFCVGPWALMYVGLVNRTISDRVKGEHLKGNIYGSTLRQSIAYLLRGALQLTVARTWTGRYYLEEDGEDMVTGWMLSHARVGWQSTDDPKTLEAKVIRVFGELLPLNIRRDHPTPFAEELKSKRVAWRKGARK